MQQYKNLPVLRGQLEETKQLLGQLEKSKGISEDRFEQMSQRYQKQVEELTEQVSSLEEQAKEQQVELQTKRELLESQLEQAREEFEEHQVLHEQGAINEDQFKSQKNQWRSTQKELTSKIKKIDSDMDELEFYLTNKGEESYQKKRVRQQANDIKDTALSKMKFITGAINGIINYKRFFWILGIVLIVTLAFNVTKILLLNDTYNIAIESFKEQKFDDFQATADSLELSSRYLHSNLYEELFEYAKQRVETNPIISLKGISVLSMSSALGKSSLTEYLQTLSILLQTENFKTKLAQNLFGLYRNSDSYQISDFNKEIIEKTKREYIKPKMLGGGGSSTSNFLRAEIFSNSSAINLNTSTDEVILLNDDISNAIIHKVDENTFYIITYSISNNDLDLIYFDQSLKGTSIIEEIYKTTSDLIKRDEEWSLYIQKEFSAECRVGEWDDLEFIFHRYGNVNTVITKQEFDDSYGSIYLQHEGKKYQEESDVYFVSYQFRRSRFDEVLDDIQKSKFSLMASEYLKQRKVLVVCDK